MYEIFNLMLGWLPPAIAIPVMVVASVGVFIVLFKLVQGLISLVSAVIGFFM